MGLILQPTEDCLEYKSRADGWVLEKRKPLGFQGGDSQNPPPLLRDAELYFLGWAFLPHRYWLSILNEGDKAYVEGFGKYPYSIIQDGKTYQTKSRGDTSRLTGDSVLFVGDILCINCNEKLKFRLKKE